MAKAFIKLTIPCFLAGIWLFFSFWGIKKTQAWASPRPLENGLIWPISGSELPDTANISSPFGPRWQASQNRYDYHPGIDIASPLGTPIHVIDNGVVTEVGWLSDEAGLSVIVYHPELDLYSAYLHLNSTDMIVDQAVSQGDIIGLVGDSGLTDFEHLHFEIRLTSDDYPLSTRNPMGYLPFTDVTTPTLQILDLQADTIYSPTVSLSITAQRSELDVNQIRVILQDRASGAMLDDQLVDFNLRTHTGDDSLDQDGIQLLPSHFNTSTQQYELSAYFYNLHGFDAFTMTALVSDLAGHTQTVVTIADDTTPPAKVTTLTAIRRADGSVELTWVAPGDSGIVGTANAYDIRYSDVPINSYTWYTAAVLLDPPAPVPGGRIQTWYLPGPFSQPAYFALKTTDLEGNTSLLSNSAQAIEPIVYLPFVTR